MITKYLGRLIYILAWPLTWAVVRNTRRSRIVIICKNEILLVKNFISANDSWTLPGGGVKGKEADKVCAARELKEELGIIVDPVDLRELGEYTNKSTGFSYTVAFLALGCDKGRKFKKGREIQQLEWFQVSKLPSNRKPLVDEAISRAKQG